MDKRLSVIRAAKLAGVTRGELQARIKSGDLPSFDGMVLVCDLLKAYPATRIEDERTLERVERIKAAALGRDIASRSLPDPRVLAQRVAALGQRLVKAQRRAEHFGKVLDELETHLRELERECPPVVQPYVREIKLRMQSELRQTRADEEGPGVLIDGGGWMSVMAPLVRLVPGNHEFLVEGADTVLDAALRAGLSISYGCSNGNCGECKARVVSGEVREVRPHDFSISESERAQGYALMCTVTPVTDLVVEVGVARTPDQIPRQSVDATVREIQRPSPHVLVVGVQTPRTRRLRFLGGQYVRIGFQDGRIHGLVPLANCPCDDRNLVFHLAENRGDAFSTHCFEYLRKGESVRVEGPFGDFVIADEIGRPPVFLACDTGFGPIKSLIEHVIALDVADAMDLVWVSGGSVGHYEDNLCRSWDDALDNFRYQAVRVGTGSDPEAWTAAVAGCLARIDDLSGRDFWVAGPPHFVDAVTALLRRLEVPTGQCRLQTVPPQP